MNRFLLGALVVAGVLVLTAFMLTKQKPPDATKVVRHEGAVTYIWDMNGSEVTGLTVVRIDPSVVDAKVLEKRHFPMTDEKK